MPDDLTHEDRRRGRVRLPLTLYVDGIEFNPEIFLDGVTRTSYDIELTGNDVRKLHQFLDERLAKGYFGSVRIRFIGRLVSQ